MPGTDAPQPDPKHVITTLVEEVRQLTDNKLYLLSVIREMREEFDDAQALWAAERQSILEERE